MAAVTQSIVVYSEGAGERVVLYRLGNVNTGDTFSCSAEFAELKAAVFVPAGALGTGVVGAIAGTTVTLTLATMANDHVYLLVIGQGVNA